MYYAGIDPGFEGAVAIVNKNSALVDVIDVPTKKVPYVNTKGKKTNRVVYDIPEMSDLLGMYPCKFVVLESVSARPGQGVVSMFRFGHGLGLWEGLLTARDVLYALVPPTDWKKHFHLLKTEKDASLEFVRRFFGTDFFKLKKHHNRADAACMAEYARYLEEGGYGADV